jgi:hypothetical protein
VSGQVPLGPRTNGGRARDPLIDGEAPYVIVARHLAIATKAVLPRVGHQCSAIESVNSLGERQFAL